LAVIEVFGLVISNCARVFLRKSSGFGLRETGLRRTSAAHKTHENGRGPSRNVHFRQRVPAPRHRAQSLDTHGKDHENVEIQREPRKRAAACDYQVFTPKSRGFEYSEESNSVHFRQLHMAGGPHAGLYCHVRLPCRIGWVPEALPMEGALSLNNSRGPSAWRDQGSFFPPWKKRSREVWMPSEPRRPDGEWGHPSRSFRFRRSVPTRRRARGEEGAADRDPSMRSALLLRQRLILRRHRHQLEHAPVA
jgi:hypothetical protein